MKKLLIALVSSLLLAGPALAKDPPKKAPPAKTEKKDKKKEPYCDEKCARYLYCVDECPSGRGFRDNGSCICDPNP